jgi:hypothetical protein
MKKKYCYIIMILNNCTNISDYKFKIVDFTFDGIYFLC